MILSFKMFDCEELWAYEALFIQCDDCIEAESKSVNVNTVSF
jgi:hypothetical protein